MDFLLHFLTFSPQNGFLFSTLDFWIFMAIVLGGMSLCYRNRRARNTFLFLCSLFFYYKVGGFFSFILITSCILNYVIGKLIERSGSHGRGIWLFVGVMVNLFVLAVFKYNVFFTQIWNALSGADMAAIDYLSESFSLQGKDSASILPAAIERMMPPVGLSFFTLQAICYLTDIKRGNCKSFAGLADFGFYLTFFPKMMAGPLIRPVEFETQMQSHYMLARREFSSALALILTGLVKKVLVADFLDAQIVSPVFDNPDLFSGMEKWIAVYGFSIWIYCAFSGYTDMAVGIAALLGFQLPANFRSPYKAASLTDFWRRWHITLYEWFRDYFYIPLGGNRYGNFRMILALILCMLAAGLWYGAGLGFLLWASVHTLALVLEKLSHWHVKVEKSRFLRLVGWFLTFHVVSFSWIFFRSGSLQSAADLFLGLFDPVGWERISDSGYTHGVAFLVLVLAAVFVLLVRQRRKKAILRVFERQSIVIQFLLTALLAATITFLKV